MSKARDFRYWVRFSFLLFLRKAKINCEGLIENGSKYCSDFPSITFGTRIREETLNTDQDIVEKKPYAGTDGD